MSEGDAALQDALVSVLRESPGLPARAIARELRDTLAEEIHKTDINPILYRERSLFRFDGYSPPRWFLIPASARSTATGSSQFTDPRRTGISPPIDGRASTSRLGSVLPRPTPRFDPGVIRQPSLRVQPRFNLHEWQREAISAWRQNDGCGIVEAVTGTGKSMVAVEILRDLLAEGKRALVLVPSIALLNQWQNVLHGDLGIEATSLLAGGFRRRLDLQSPVTIGVVNSVSQTVDEIDGLFDLLIADECHRYGAHTFQRALLPSARYRLGLTATLERSDNAVDEVLRPYFADTCYEYGYERAREDRVIAPYSVLSIGVHLREESREDYEHASTTMSKARWELLQTFGYPSGSFGAFMERAQSAKRFFDREGKVAGRFLSAMSAKQQILAECPEKMEAVADLADAVQASTGALVFTQTIKGAEQASCLLQGRGVQSAVYHSDLSDAERSDILEDLTDKSIKCVVAARALDEGVDVPDVDLGIIVSGGRQRRQMVQRMGRVVRNKDDGRGAVFIVLFAKGTTEDPALTTDEEDRLKELRENAERNLSWDAATLRLLKLEDLVLDWICDPLSRSPS